MDEHLRLNERNAVDINVVLVMFYPMANNSGKFL